MAFQFEPSVIIDTLPLLMRGAKLTVIITVGGLFFGFILGSVFGLMKISRNMLLRKCAGFYIETIRGTPMLVQAMFLYYGIPMAIGIRIPPLTAGIAVIAVNSGAYIAEIVRGAVQSINVGQMEAGRSIGLTHAQSMLYVVWPQAFKRMIPPLGNQFIISLKDTSLLMVIGGGRTAAYGPGNRSSQLSGLRGLHRRGHRLPGHDHDHFQIAANARKQTQHQDQITQTTRTLR